ncbi:hypothetical protein QWT69_06110 [Sporosarcina oncorhynchi]|uniref:Uncharacterized protein n=1 Tax=Sporosarcina oncorhynchi TaxID=3056444 RepID=A0ABZ0L9N2_9BACL|nr:hypothetical protein [Sporosarcina sp. T2O-4]WOV88678.1 hypothetical protein QWT69_06110 [Sporosarcina sp. T2O-4]
MIPVEVENRIAKYFFHNYLPEEIMDEIIDVLIPQCLNVEEEDIDHDELVMDAVLILLALLDEKSIK